MLGEVKLLRRSGRGAFSIASSTAPLEQVAALSYFDFFFTEGDRPLREMTLLRGTRPGFGSAGCAFIDRDQGALAEIEAGYVNLSHGKTVESYIPGRTVYATSDGASLLHRVPDQRPPGHAFALAGFSMKYLGGGINARQLGVSKHRDEEHWVYIAATFTDDSFVHLTSPNEVKVQYVWIPDALVADRGRVMGGAGGRREKGAIPPGPAVISGFHCKFLNTPHPVRRIQVTTHDGGMVRFQDNNEDDPVSWTLDYLLLRGG